MKKTVTSVPKIAAFPSFMVVLQESWQMVSSKLLQLIGLSFVAGLLSVALFVGGTIATVAKADLHLDFKTLRAENPDPALARQFGEQLISKAPVLLVGLLVTTLISSLVSLLLGIVFVQLLGEKEPRGMMEHIKRALARILPFFIMQTIIGVLVFGNAMLLFIPGLLVSFLLGYAAIELVLYEGGIFSSMKRSVRVVGTHLGTILGYTILWVLAYVLVVFFIPNVLLKIEPATGGFVMLLRGLFSAVLNWLSIAFSMKLYEHARKRTVVGQGSSMLLMIIGAAIGLTIFGLTSALLVKAIKALNIPEKIREELAKGSKQTVDYEMIPSACGVSIPRPATTDAGGDETLERMIDSRSWIYEEVAMAPTTFAPLDTDVHPREFTLGAIMGYRAEPFAAGTTNYALTFPAVQVKCTENPKNYTLDEYLALAKANKRFDVTVGQRGKLGEVDTVGVTLTTEVKGETASENGYLAVSKDGNRLLYITVWGGDKDDVTSEQVKADTDAIMYNLKYRDVDAQLTLPQQIKKPAAAAAAAKTTTGSSGGCKQLTISQGEFASDKCYSASDYAELTKYIAGFDSAVFSYNAAASKANVTCNGFTESFKQQCEQAKADIAKAQESMNGYRTAINAVIARGK